MKLTFEQFKEKFTARYELEANESMLMIELQELYKEYENAYNDGFADGKRSLPMQPMKRYIEPEAHKERNYVKPQLHTPEHPGPVKRIPKTDQ